MTDATDPAAIAARCKLQSKRVFPLDQRGGYSFDMTAWVLDEAAALITRQAHDIARLRAVVAGIMGKLDDGRDAPGHSHQIAGVWDDDSPPELAGKRCTWCAQWNRARAAVQPSTKEPL